MRNSSLHRIFCGDQAKNLRLGIRAADVRSVVNSLLAARREAADDDPCRGIFHPFN